MGVHQLFIELRRDFYRHTNPTQDGRRGGSMEFLLIVI